MRIFTGILLVLCVIYGAFELQRWRSAELSEILSRRQRMRRAITFVALCVVIAMCFGGTWLPTSDRTKADAVFQLAYWSVCLAAAAIVPIIAVWDLRSIMRQARQSSLARERDESLVKVIETVAKSEEKARRREQLPHRNGHG